MQPGRLVGLLGPNGAGKTTLLRILAGLLVPDEGRVVLDGRVLDDTATGEHVPAEARPVGVVFQNYVLFPHLSALENVAFGLRARGVPKAEARARASEWLDRVGLSEFRMSKPKQLSGGQAQRVALARALATEPRLLLLDEPLAALDASTRLETRRELRRQLDGYDGVRVLVTHDPMEAIALAERLVVLEAGHISQSGTPQEISERPRSRYVADLVGVNLFQGRAAGDEVLIGAAGRLVAPGAGRGEVFAVVHPHAVSLYRQPPAGTPRNVWQGTAESLDLEGERVRVRVGGPLPIIAEVTPGAVADLRLGDGGPVWVSVKATEVVVYPV
ncbi:MAG: molybdate transport system ATP-binding protein [Actinomycetota bacterium]|nr:molybdate transport system ATP-binding protein [Actinomycetota bacterium]